VITSNYQLVQVRWYGPFSVEEIIEKKRDEVTDKGLYQI